MKPTAGDAPDPVTITQRLVRRPSVAPLDAGVFGDLETTLAPLGFHCQRIFSDADDGAPVDMLFAHIGEGAPHLCFVGHADVAPPGVEDMWTEPPFAGLVLEDVLTARGATDMKGAIAAFISASARVRKAHPDFDGTISLLISGGEYLPRPENDGVVRERIAHLIEDVDHGLCGAPSSEGRVGDALALAHGGAIVARMTIQGRQGRIGAPGTENPGSALLTLLEALRAASDGEARKQGAPFRVEATSLSTAESVWSMIPATASAEVTILFDSQWNGRALKSYIERTLETAAEPFQFDWTFETTCVSEPVRAPEDPFVDLVSECVAAATGAAPRRHLDAAPSSAKLLAGTCPVVGLGLVADASHRIDEQLPISDIALLTDLYEAVLKRYFSLC